MKKNFWTKMLGLMLVLICAFSLAACGGKKSIAGTYNLDTISMSGVTMDVNELADYLGEAGAELKIALVLKDDGSFTLDMSAIDESQSQEGTWEDKNGALDLTADNETITADYKDGVITLTEETSGMSMVFKK